MRRAVTPDVWGPPFWTSMYAVAMGFPDSPTEDERLAYVAFFKSLRYVLPCGICASHYRRMEDERPVEGSVGSAEELFSWVNSLHNMTSERLGKPSMSEEFARDHYVFGERDQGEHGGYQPPSTGGESPGLGGGVQGVQGRGGRIAVALGCLTFFIFAVICVAFVVA